MRAMGGHGDPLAEACETAFASFEKDGKWPYVVIKGFELVSHGNTVTLSATHAASLSGVRSWAPDVRSQGHEATIGI